MATYKEIRGFNIKSVATDPSNLSVGEIWYNSTSGTLKVYQNLGAAWSSGAALNQKATAVGGWGPQTAATVAGGNTDPGVTGATQLYDGSTWTTSPVSLSPVRSEGGTSQAGTQTAAWYSGGVAPGGRSNATEEFDGSAWTTSNVYPLSISMAGAGTLTAGLGFGGYQPATPEMFKRTTNEYNGTSWTAANNMNTGRAQNGTTGVGLQTAALTAAGTSGPPAPLTNMVNCESYDGSTWSVENALPVGRSSNGLFGTASIAKIFGGRTPPVPTISDTTSDWDGTSWAASPATLATARVSMAAAGTTGIAGLCAGGYPPGSAVDLVEEYIDPTITTQTITTS